MNQASVMRANTHIMSTCARRNSSASATCSPSMSQDARRGRATRTSTTATSVHCKCVEQRKAVIYARRNSSLSIRIVASAENNKGFGKKRQAKGNMNEKKNGGGEGLSTTTLTSASGDTVVKSGNNADDDDDDDDGDQTIDEIVSGRILKRIILFSGVPLILGFVSFPSLLLYMRLANEYVDIFIYVFSCLLYTYIYIYLTSSYQEIFVIKSHMTDFGV